MSSEANNDTADAPATPLTAPEPPQNVDAASDTAGAALPSVIIDPSLDQPSHEPASSALPSVMVDPAMSTPSHVDETALASAPPTPAAETSDVRERDSNDDGAWSAGAFSDHDADRFAESMRPSWDMAVADAESGWSAPHVSMTTGNVAHVPTGRVIAPSNDSDGLPPVVLTRGLDKRLAFAGVGGLLLIIIAIWSMVDSEPEVPPSWNGATPAAPVTSAANKPSLSTTTSQAVNAPAQPSQPVPPTAPSPAPIATPIAAAPVPTPTPSTPATAAPAVAKTVHVRIATTPSGAVLKLDGEQVPNPFDAWVTRGGTHNVVADADGYTQREWSIAFDQDQTLSLVLKREEAKRPARRARRVAPRSAPRTTPSKSRPRGAGFVTDNPY